MNKTVCALLSAALLALAAWYIRQMCALAHVVDSIRPQTKRPHPMD